MATTPSQVNIPIIATIGAVSTIALVGVVIAMQGWMGHELDAMRPARLFDRPDRALEKLNRQQEATLASYRLVDEENAIYAIPIELAMKKVTEQNHADR